MAAIFEFSSYKGYLESKVGKRRQRLGVKSAIAKALNCQPTYISQVLHGHAHLSLEQADQLNGFFGHGKEEAQYFLLLVQAERAGTESLRSHFQEQIEELKKQRLILTKRLGARNELSQEDRVRYYSTWHYAALHIAVTIHDLQRPEQLAEFFRLSLAKVSEILAFLERAGLIHAKADGSFEAGTTAIRLGNDSPNIVRHHSNWRLMAMESLDRETVRDMHYSAVVSLSREDALRIKDRLLENLKKDLEIIRSSKEEELYSYCLDFFDLRRG